MMRTATTAPFRALRRSPKSLVQSRSSQLSTSRPSSNASNDAQKKAQDTLNDVPSGAKSSIEKAQNSKVWATAKDGLAQAKESEVWGKAQAAFGPVGQNAGQALARYREPLFYNLAVAKEFMKQVYVAELQPPTSFAQVKLVYQTIWQQATTRAFWRDAINKGELTRLGVYGLQAYGLFKIGEMVGRFNLVGYNLH